MKVIYSLEDWKIFAEISIRSFFLGILRPIWLIIVGVISLCNYLWKLSLKFVRKNPSYAVVVFVIVVFMTWLLTFVSMRTRAVGAEFQRDSISYELSRYVDK